MIIAVTNLTAHVISIDSLQLSLPPHGMRTHIMDGKEITKKVSAELAQLQKKSFIAYTVMEDPDIDDAFEPAQLAMLQGFYKVDMLDAANVTGGGTTRTVGFQLRDVAGKPITAVALVEFAVFDDIYVSTPAVVATLNTASKGTIVAGAGTAALKVLTNATGQFECTLTDTADEAVYLSADSTFGGPALDCREKDVVTFSA